MEKTQESKTQTTIQPPKPLPFQPPKPPVLTPNVAELLKNANSQNASLPPQPPSQFQPIVNPFLLKNQEKKIIESENLKKEKEAEEESRSSKIAITPIVEIKEKNSPACFEVPKVPIIETNSNHLNQQPKVSNDRIDMSGGLVSWLTKTVAESKLLNEVAEKAKAGMETVLTTLDPGMKPFLTEHGVIELSMINCDVDVIEAGKDGFIKAGALVVLRGIPIEDESFRLLVMGDENAKKACLNRLEKAEKYKKTYSKLTNGMIVLQPFIIKISDKFYSTTKLMLNMGDFQCDAIGQLIQIPKNVVDFIIQKSKNDGLPEDQFSISVAEGVKEVLNSSNETWQPGNLPPFSSSEFLTLGFASLAQQLLLKIEQSK